LNFNINSLEILGTLEFDKIWLASSLLHLIGRKNKFPVKEDQKFEFQLKREFGLLLQSLNFKLPFEIPLLDLGSY
jgi:hypothetical protein